MTCTTKDMENSFQASIPLMMFFYSRQNSTPLMMLVLNHLEIVGYRKTLVIETLSRKEETGIPIICFLSLPW